MKPALAFDSSVLSPFARAKRLTMLERLTAGHRRVATRAVFEEIDRGQPMWPALAEVRSLTWLEVVQSDSLQELTVFNAYIRILGADDRNVGESSILAWAEINGGVVLIDDQTAVNAARDRGVAVRRSLALVATGMQLGLLTSEEVRVLVDELVSGGARFPCDGTEFERWAEAHGLLLPAAK